MSGLASTLELRTRTQRTQALRALLAGGIVRRGHDEAWEAVRRHEPWIRLWLVEQVGWGLRVDGQAGYARINRVPAVVDATRPAADAHGRPFDRRRYVLLSLTCAALHETPAQTTLEQLAESLRSLTASIDGIDEFEPTLQAERRAFVDCLRWLLERGAIRRRDGDEERYLRSSGRGDVLYDVEDRLVPHLLGAPRGPASVDEPMQLYAEHYADTPEGRTQRARFSVMRRLVDEPVVYFEDLDDEERDWLLRSWRRVVERMSDLGLVLERRLEGVAAIDPEGGLSDRPFPTARSTADHVALLLCDHLCQVRSASLAEIVEFLSGLADEYRGRWRDAPAEELALEGLATLEAFRLARRDGEHWRCRPAAARFRVAGESE